MVHAKVTWILITLVKPDMMHEWLLDFFHHDFNLSRKLAYTVN